MHVVSGSAHPGEAGNIHWVSLSAARLSNYCYPCHRFLSVSLFATKLASLLGTSRHCRETLLLIAIVDRALVDAVAAGNWVNGNPSFLLCLFVDILRV